jgi:hypothetical protein
MPPDPLKRLDGFLTGLGEIEDSGEQGERIPLPLPKERNDR